MIESGTPLLAMLNISKQFPGVRALDNVSIALHAGECLGLIGENGAGKSTLIKILGGITSPSAGEIRLEGRPVRIQTPAAATNLGIRVIHQELNLCDNLDVSANVFLGREIRRGGRIGLIDRAAMRHRSQELCAQVGLDLPQSTPVGRLTAATRQRVEIAKALAVDARILVMDEPTSSLSRSETERLFEIIRHLKAQGVSILYISHRMPEILALTDRVFCLRDGVAVGEGPTARTDHESLVKMMIGRKLSTLFVKESEPRDEIGLEVRGLRLAGSSHTYDFHVRKGEVLGLAGLVGAGRTELVETLFGVRRREAGEVRVDGRRVPAGSPRQAIRAGLSLVPEDRRRHGLVLALTVAENLVLGRQGRDGPLGRIRRRAIAADARDQIDRLKIRTPSERTVARTLSGGNQQKVVLGKWLSLDLKVLILDEPTRGIDVGSKQEVYALIARLAAAGLAIVLISSEMEEILVLSDRVMVLHEGRCAGTLSREQIDEESIMRMASGLNR